VALKALRGVAREVLRGLGCHEDAELSILLTDNEGIRALNRRYLDRDRPTDVLSFPMWDFNSELRTPNSELILGDVVISIEKAGKQAEELDVTMDEELSRLLVHGILHIFGFDHEKGRREAVRMRKEEERLLTIAKCKLQNVK